MTEPLAARQLLITIGCTGTSITHESVQRVLGLALVSASRAYPIWDRIRSLARKCRFA